MTTDDRQSHNAFEKGKPETPARDQAQGAIEDLRQRGGVFVDAVHATRTPMVLTDPGLAGNPIIFANQSFLDLSGYGMEEVLGQQPHFMNGVGTDPQDAARFRRALELDQDTVVETVQYRKNGSRFLASVFLSAFKDEDGRTLHQFLTFQDVTRRETAEDRLAASVLREAAATDGEVRLRLLLGTQATWETNADGVVTADSPSWRAYTGQTLEEWLGYGWLNAIHPDDRTYAREQWREAIAHRAPVNAEFRLCTPEGGWRWTNVRAVLVPDAEGGVAKWVGMNIDIDARKCAEAVLREREEQQAFLLRLGDQLRAEPNADAIAVRALGMLREHLRLDRCYVGVYRLADDLGDFPYQVAADGLAPIPSQVRLSDFPESLRVATEQTLVVEDADTMEGLSDADRASIVGLGFRAFVAASLHIGEKQPLWAIVAVSTRPRRWTNNEIALVEAVTDRTWAAIELARTEAATRAGERRRAFLLALSDAFRAQAGEEDTGAIATRMVAEHLRVDRCYIAYLPRGEGKGSIGSEYRSPQLPPLAGEYRFEDFPEAMKRLETGPLVIRDVLNDASLSDADKRSIGATMGLHGLLAAVLRKGEDHYFWCLTAATTAPRDWSDDDLKLLQDVAERTWSAMERRRVEAALRESELRFREFGENSSDALWIINAETGQLEYLSPAYERIWGESRDAVMADISHWAELAHPDDRAAASQAMPRLLAGEAFQADYRIIRPDGDVRWIRDVGFPIKVDGVVRRGGGIAQDVTDLKRAEAAVRESEARLRDFGDASQDVLWIRDAETLQWQYLTPAFETIYGQRREEALSGNNYRGWLELIVPEDRAPAMKNIERVRAGEQVAFEYRIRRPSDDTVRWLRNTDFPIRDEAGRVTLIGGIGHDFTELRETELRLQALIEGIPQLVWRADAPGLWTWASPQWTAFTGQEEPDSHGWGWLAPLHPDDRDVARGAWSRAAERGELQVEYRIGDREGDYRWFQTRAVPLRDVDGEIVEWLGTSTDIHDLRLLQDRQQVMVQELQHRTRNLITVVSALSKQTLKNAASLTDFDQHFSDRLAALSRVQGLLSHLSAGKRVTFDELLGSELAALGAPDARVTLDGPKGVALRSAMVQTFSLALHELATNALKYGALAAPQGHLTVHWELTHSDRDGPRLHVDWRETGVDMTHVNGVGLGGGYGRELIERALPYQLDAETTYELAAEGVHCTINVPASTVATGSD